MGKPPLPPGGRGELPILQVGVMPVSGALVSEMYALELLLWTRATRYDRDLMDQIFAPDFHEFGRSGRRYPREETLLDERDAREFDAVLHGFAVHPLSELIVHCTYISELRHAGETERANRSSFWDRATGRWLLRFHQGTPLPAGVHP